MRTELYQLRIAPTFQRVRVSLQPEHNFGVAASLSAACFAGTGSQSGADIVLDYERGTGEHKILEKLAALAGENEN